MEAPLSDATLSARDLPADAALIRIPASARLGRIIPATSAQINPPLLQANAPHFILVTVCYLD